MSTEQILYQLKMDFVGGGVQNVVQMSNWMMPMKLIQSSGIISIWVFSQFTISQ